MHKIQRTQRKGQPHTTGTRAAEATAISMKGDKREVAHTQQNKKNVNIPVVASKCCVEIG